MPAHVGIVGGAGETLRHTPALWNAYKGGLELALSGYDGAAVHDNFIQLPRFNAGSVVTNARYGAYSDTGCGIRPAGIRGGAALFDHDGTANDECVLQVGSTAGASFSVPSTGGTTLCFETMLRKTSVTDSALGFFVGIGEEGFGLASGDALVDTTLAVADKDYIGFSNLTDGDAVNFVYKKAGQTAQTVGTSATALAAATWIKLGFVYSPGFPAGKRIKWFINGTEQSTYVTQTQIEAATFPAGELMSPIAASKNVTAAATTFFLRFWSCAQKEVA